MWAPKFDAMVPRQEQLAVQFATEIAGDRPSAPDPVRLLEMAEQLYKAEANSQIDDLAMLVRMLAYALKRRDPASLLAARATKYLSNSGLAGNPLRDEEYP